MTKQSWNKAVSTPSFPNHIGILKTSIEIEPSISMVVLMDSKEQSGDTVRRRVLNIMYREALPTQISGSADTRENCPKSSRFG